MSAWPDRFIFVLLVLFLAIVPGASTVPDANAIEPAEHTVTIPQGAANPTIDLTLQNVGNWYDPRRLTITQGDTVTWVNDDTEPHTVTSGVGAGIQSVQTGEKGRSDGIFDSDFFGSGESWSYTFENSGTFAYFCIIHPWMEAVVVVESAIPDYPVDASGNRQDVWPVHTYSTEGRYDIDLAWDPKVPVTGETVTFVADFFDAKTNQRLQLTPYEFVVMQDGKELDRIYSLTQVGIGLHKYIFSESGPVEIKIESVGDFKGEFSEFSTIVYSNPESSSQGNGLVRVEGGSQPVSRVINPLTLVWVTYAVIFSLPAAAAAIVILYKKGRI